VGSSGWKREKLVGAPRGVLSTELRGAALPPARGAPCPTWATRQTTTHTLNLNILPVVWGVL